MMVSRNESCAKTVWVIRKTIPGRASLFFIPHVTFIICFAPQRTGNRRLSVSTKALLAESETISNGDFPRFHANTNRITSATPVTMKFGHAFNSHCPFQVNCILFENGTHSPNIICALCKRLTIRFTVSRLATLRSRT